jgi:hypothetical protein
MIQGQQEAKAIVDTLKEQGIQAFSQNGKGSVFASEYNREMPMLSQHSSKLEKIIKIGTQQQGFAV